MHRAPKLKLAGNTQETSFYCDYTYYNTVMLLFSLLVFFNVLLSRKIEKQIAQFLGQLLREQKSFTDHSRYCTSTGQCFPIFLRIDQKNQRLVSNQFSLVHTYTPNYEGLQPGGSGDDHGQFESNNLFSFLADACATSRLENRAERGERGGIFSRSGT